jgi:hypothetical protein
LLQSAATRNYYSACRILKKFKNCVAVFAAACLSGRQGDLRQKMHSQPAAGWLFDQHLFQANPLLLIAKQAGCISFFYILVTRFAGENACYLCSMLFNLLIKKPWLLCLISNFCLAIFVTGF